MRNARKLALKRESLAALTTDEMTSVVGGTHFCALTDTCADPITHGLSIDQPCPSNPITACTVIIGVSNVRTVC